MNEHINELKTDEEFAVLIQPLTENEYTSLKDNIRRIGCIKPITVWENTIIDGNKRYRICCDYNIPFSSVSVFFQKRCDAISHICTSQLSRKDLTHEYWRYLIGRLFQAEAEISARISLSSDLPSDKESERPCNKYEIAMRIGANYNISHATVIKYEAFARALDSIRSKEPEISAKILMGQIKISHENIIEVSRLPKEDLKRIKNILFSKGMERISYSEIRYELQWQRLPVFLKEKKKTKMPIHKMPEYDPDAEVSSLALTIPSWISSTEHVNAHTDFNKITVEARENLLKQLNNLKQTIYTIENSLRRNYND